MERFLGVEEARGRLGQLAEEVAAGGEPIILSKRGRALAVIMSRDEYSKLKRAATEQVRAELLARLAEIRKKIQQAGLEPEAVDEAISTSRKLA